MERIDNFSFKFNQEKFIVNSASKADLDNLDLSSVDKFQLQVERSFTILPHETNKLLAKVVSDAKVALVWKNDGYLDYILIKTSTYFKFEDIATYEDENTRHLLISQANMQTTDIINGLLCKGELQGSPIGYNFHHID